MPLSGSGKYFANPKRMQAMDPQTDPSAQAAPAMDASQGDPNDPMIQCPSCGDTFPMSQGMQAQEANQQEMAGGMSEAAMGDPSSAGM